MKLITRIRLINWHRFENETINLKNFVLISGDNAIGKTTIADAIQFCFTVPQRYFNIAANEKDNKRTLAGYVRYYTGNEINKYNRFGEVSSHIALEIFEPITNKYFILGTVIDSPSENETKVFRYLIDNERFNDDLFYTNEIPKSALQFRTTNQDKIVQWCSTIKDARQMIRNRVGRIDEKIFDLFPKALGLKAIKNITEFIYENILEEHNIESDIMRENVLSYTALQDTLKKIKEKMTALEKIERQYGIISNAENKEKMYEYLVEKANLDILESNINILEGEIKEQISNNKEQKEKIEEIKKEKKEKDILRRDILKDLSNNENFNAIDEQKKSLERLEFEHERLNNEYKVFMSNVDKAKKNIAALLEIKHNNELLLKYYKCLQDISIDSNVQQIHGLALDVENLKKHLKTNAYKTKYDLESELASLKKEKYDVENKLKSLKMKNLEFPKAVVHLLEEIKKGCEKLELNPEPRILCELLEITDDSWRNAVEGYLNTQRLHIIINPEAFDVAINIYDKLRKKEDIHNYGIINVQKLDEYDEAPEDSLATVVNSKNKYAKRYINMILGSVKMCTSPSELKNHKKSITKNCLKYQNHVVTSINPNIYKNPYIGKDAIKIQLKEAELIQKKLADDVSEKTKQLNDLNKLLVLLDTEREHDMKYKSNVLYFLKVNENEIKQCKKNIESLNNADCGLLLSMQNTLNTLEEEISAMEIDISNRDRCIGTIENDIETKKGELKKEKLMFSQKADICAALLEENQDNKETWIKKYETEIKDKNFEQFLANYDKQKKSNLSFKEKQEKKLIEVMLNYNNLYDFGAPCGVDGYLEYEAEYIKLKNSEILVYEEKVEEARAKAEVEFQEQFLCKLQEQIKMAQNTFKSLNKTLKNIEFNGDRYEFVYSPNKTYKKFYNMIMDDFNTVAGESLFTATFRSTYKEEIQELFDILKLDKDTSTLDILTDYRSYMDYDIKIIHSDNDYSLYSNTYGSDSGGEAQTPFYIIMAASFVQLYKNGINDETLGLIMFDEVFSNMDDSRAASVIEFLKQLPLQIIMIAPSGKINSIGGLVDETLLVLKDEDMSYVEEMYNENL